MKMELMEIILLLAGAAIFILSFFIPDKKSGEAQAPGVEEEVQKAVEKQMEAVQSHVNDVVDEAVEYAMEKTERSLERISNEKIMAVNEYSDTVLSEIHKNHEEAMFLYDMLNSKHDNLKNTVSEVNRTMKEAEERVSAIQNGLPGAGSKERGTEKNTGESGTRESSVQESSVQKSSAQKNDVQAEEIQNRKSRQRKAQDNTAQDSSTEQGGTVRDSNVQDRNLQNGDFQSGGISDKTGNDLTGAERISFMGENDGEGQNNNEKILALHRQGKSRVAIAKELGLGVGEVKLVLDLYQNQQ